MKYALITVLLSVFVFCSSPTAPTPAVVEKVEIGLVPPGSFTCGWDYEQIKIYGPEGLVEVFTSYESDTVLVKVSQGDTLSRRTYGPRRSQYVKCDRSLFVAENGKVWDLGE